MVVCSVGSLLCIGMLLVDSEFDELGNARKLALFSEFAPARVLRDVHFFLSFKHAGLFP